MMEWVQNHIPGKRAPRTATLQVDPMFCPHERVSAVKGVAAAFSLKCADCKGLLDETAARAFTGAGYRAGLSS